MSQPLEVKFPAHLMKEAKKWAGDDTNSETESEFGCTPVSSNYAMSFNP